VVVRVLRAAGCLRWTETRQRVDGGVCDGPGSTTVDITEPVWRMIRSGALEEKEIAECLQPA
jgi:tRNA A37 threonylcarbamoyladenosine synthetase subunit TsaC/SUA5/YrdC